MKKLKSKKQYTIPMSPALKNTLTEYLRHRKGEPEDYVFVNQYGGQLTVSSVDTLVRKYNKSRDVLKTSVHLFRHTFAKTWIKTGGDPFALQLILGHSTLDMVKKYVALYGNDLQNKFVLHSALDQTCKNMHCSENRLTIKNKNT